MSYGSYSWTFEDLPVMNDIADAEPKLVNVEFSLTCTHPGEAPSGQFGLPEFYDPGEGATWEIDTIEIVFDTVKTLTVTEEQLSQLFPNGDDMMNNALESAADNGVID